MNTRTQAYTLTHDKHTLAQNHTNTFISTMALAYVHKDKLCSHY